MSTDVTAILRYWGKADPKYPGEPKWHPLAYHCLDVAACGRMLLQRQPAWLRLLADLSGIPEARLADWAVFLLTVHDIGKFGNGFQTLPTNPFDLEPKGADMEAKRQMGWSEMPPVQRPGLALLAYEAGRDWLRAREEKLGFCLDTQGLRVDGYATHCLKGRRDESGRCRGISLSTLDFEGVLTVADVPAFTRALFQGVGPAKGFGCGMLLIRRA